MPNNIAIIIETYDEIKNISKSVCVIQKNERASIIRINIVCYRICSLELIIPPNKFTFFIA